MNQVAALTATSARAAASQGQSGVRRDAAVAAARTAELASVPESELSANDRSLADWKRCSGVFSRQRRTMRSSAEKRGDWRRRNGRTNDRTTAWTIRRVVLQNRGHGFGRGYRGGKRALRRAFRKVCSVFFRGLARVVGSEARRRRCGRRVQGDDLIHVRHLQDLLHVPLAPATRNSPPVFFIWPADITMIPIPVLSTLLTAARSKPAAASRCRFCGSTARVKLVPFPKRMRSGVFTQAAKPVPQPAS